MTAVRVGTGFSRGEPVRFSVDGEPVEAHAGETLAAALMAGGRLRLRSSPRAQGPRGAFCFMGVCQECVMRVDGVLRQSCQLTVAAGIVVERAGAL